MKVQSSATDDLAKIIEIRTQEIKHWRNMIDKHAEGENQLKQFKSLLTDTEEKFARFQDMIHNNHETAEILETKLTKTLVERSKTIDTLKNDIQNLKRSIDNQTSENDLLEKKLKEDAEKLNKLKYAGDHTNSFSSNSLAEPVGPFIQRLRRELK